MDSLWDLLRFYSHYRLLDINQVQLTKSHENDLAKTLNLQEQESTPNQKYYAPYAVFALRLSARTLQKPHRIHAQISYGKIWG